MKVRIKKLNKDAVIPQYAHPTDAGLDLVAVSKEADINGNIIYHTGIAVEIPAGYVGLVFPRSSVSNTALILSNCVGVIDSGYRGEILFKFKPIVAGSRTYNPGDRIGQLIILKYPTIEFQEVDELSTSDRGTGSYGSTGK